MSWACLSDADHDASTNALPPGWHVPQAPANDCRAEETAVVRTGAANALTIRPDFAPAPTNLRAAVAANTVRLDWDQAPGVSAWQVEVGSGPGLSNLATLRTGSPALVASSVPNGVYYVRVRSAPPDYSDRSIPSNEVVVSVGTGCGGPPGPPSGLFLQALAGSTVTLVWTAGTASPTSYIVEVGATPGTNNLFVFDTGNAATSLTAVAPAGVYYIRLRAKSPCGVSGVSNEIAVTVGSTTPPSPPPPPPPSPPGNSPPTFATTALVQSAYRTARFTGDVRDADGTLARVVINWGDNTQDTVTSGFGSISRTHVYGNARSYTVIVFATDNLGGTSQTTRAVTITRPPERCLNLEVAEICSRPASDFETLNVAVRAFGDTLTTFALTTASRTIGLPLGGQLTATFNFVTGRLRLRGEFCPLVFACTGVFDETIQF